MRQPALILVVSALLFSTFLPQSLTGQSTTSTSPTPPSGTASSGPKPIRDEQALNVIQTAIAALGGTTAIGQVQSLQVQAQMQNADPNASGTMTWEMSGSEFRIATNIGSKSGVMVTGYGSPTTSANGISRAVPQFVKNAIFIPAFVSVELLNELQNAQYSFRYVGSTTVNGTAATVIETALTDSRVDGRVTLQKWYFAATNLPIRVEYLLPSEKTPYAAMPGAVDLANYEAVSGVMFPFTITPYHWKQPFGTVSVQSVNVNPTIAASDFDPPTAGAQ